MGMDFSAILRYRGFKRCSQQIKALEKHTPLEFDRVRERWRSAGFFHFWERRSYTAWIDPETLRQVKRPKDKPQLGVSLYTPHGFLIKFGKDAFVAQHLLRWRVFLTELDWQSVMLDACAALADLFDADDCLLAHDSHPIMRSFRAGRNFDACIADVPDDDCDVSSIRDLYSEIDESSELVMKTESGWASPTVWDSKGYWRFPWREYVT